MQFALLIGEGTHQWYEATGQPIAWGGTAQGGVVTIRDITERRLRLLQEEFLVMATHELRSPLTSLQMALQLLAKQLLTDDADADVATALRLALRQGQRLRVLVNDLLDVGRVQQDKLHLQLAAVDLGELLTGTIAMLQLDAPTPKISLHRGGEPLVVMADSARIEQIVLNLLTNAVKYAPGTQQIDVRLRRVAGSTGDEAELQVQDYGPGISAAELPQIFTRYFQSAQVAPGARDGLGLGLFITRELVTAHNGTITAASVVGEGTTFTVRLPLQGPGDHMAAVRAPMRQRKLSSAGKGND